MTVSQIGRTKNSVTINVSGITEGDRQTKVWIPGNFLNSTNGKWYTLQNAKSAGYISDYYVADITANNGDITVYMNENYLNEGFRIVAFNVENISSSGSLLNSIEIFNAVLKFEYERSFPKYQGNDIDITVADMKEINLFGLYIDAWIIGGEGRYYTLDGVSIGDNIYYEYLWQPAQNILNAANIHPWLTGAYRSMVLDYTTPIVDGCYERADFKALFFNGILYAINSFNLSVTI